MERGKSRDGESVGQWPPTCWRTERQTHLSADSDSPSPWFWSDSEDKHFPTACLEAEGSMKCASVVYPEAKGHLFQEQPSTSSDLWYPILLWGRHLALDLCVSQPSVLVLAFLSLPISGSHWFITCQITFILAACQGGAWAKNTVEQKVPHA